MEKRDRRNKGGDTVEKIIEAEILSEGKTKLKITLANGETVVGYFNGIMPAFDDEGEELEYEVLSFTSVTPELYIRLRNKDIVKVEKA